MTQLQSFTDPQHFFTTALPFWEANPIANNLQWSLAEKYAAVGKVSRAFVLRRNDTIYAVGLQTDPPRPLILQAREPLDGQDIQLIENYCQHIPALIALKPVADDYLLSSRYAAVGQVVLVGYCLAEVVPGFSRPNGLLVPASVVSLTLLTQWMEDFLLFVEELGGDRNYEGRVRSLMEAGQLFVYLVDGVPVSMAGSTRSNGGVAAVNYVFTPEELRGNGYAYSCVGELSQRLLKTHDYCVLYADKHYPASNRVYEKLGYQKIDESIEVSF